MDRQFQVVYRARIEAALNPEAWEIFQHGSTWHAEDLPHEGLGIWGQTYTGFVDRHGRFNVMFPCLNRDQVGTINIASRPWNQPYRDRGFVFAGHQNPAFTFIQQAYGDFALETTFTRRGGQTFFWGYQGPLAPNAACYGATLHPRSWSNLAGVELNDTGWRLIVADGTGTVRSLAEGKRSIGRQTTLRVRTRGDHVQLELNGTLVHEQAGLTNRPGRIGILVAKDSRVEVERFAVTGVSCAAPLDYLYPEGLLGAGQNIADWTDVTSPGLRHGLGAISKKPQARIKYNFTGRSFAVWSPTGPRYGRAEVLVDGARVADLDLHTATENPSKVLFQSGDLKPGNHAVVLRARQGALVADSITINQ